LKKNWGQVKKVLGFAWQPNSWDADQDGVEEGAQPNTMDVTYYGKWYVGDARSILIKIIRY
jgi:non-lysosomal glucosylceramidase